MADAKSFERLMIEGTRAGLVVRFAHSKIIAADEIQAVGRELLRAADIAASIDMPLILNFHGVEDISPAMLSKIKLLRKKTRSHGVTMLVSDISPALREIIRKTMGDEGVALG
jgi:anti-anti-sigma regulatory factor